MIPIEVLNRESKQTCIVYHIHNTTAYYIDHVGEFHSMSINDLNKNWEYLGMYNNTVKED